MGARLVVHVIYRLDVGGLENGLVNLINHMPRGEFRHAIVCLAGYSDFRKRIQDQDVNVFSLDKKPGKDVGAYFRFFKLLRKLRPAIVHTRNLGTVDLQWISWLAGVKIRIHGEHGWYAGDLKGDNVKSLRIRRLCKFAIQRYSAVSEDIARWLREQVGVASARVNQIYNGVDAERFSTSVELPNDYPWRSVPVDSLFVFGTVGRLDPIKNQLGLLEAFAKIVREENEGTELRLLIGGDGPMRAALTQRIDELGIGSKVWMAGARSDVPSLLRACDVFVLPSLNEGISNTILEAMAAGKPVVAARVGGNGELIEPGKTGRLYESHDPDGLVAAMKWYLSHRAEARMQGATGREHVQQRFSMPAMVRGYSALYRQAIGTAPV